MTDNFYNQNTIVKSSFPGLNTFCAVIYNLLHNILQLNPICHGHVLEMGFWWI